MTERLKSSFVQKLNKKQLQSRLTSTTVTTQKKYEGSNIWRIDITHKYWQTLQ